MNSVEYTCKCKKMKTLITEDKKSDPCPVCGRQYIGKYNRKKYTIDAIEVKNET